MGNILYVGGQGPGNYTHIQDAVDAAIDGDTVYVYAKVYFETIVVNKSINLIGQAREITGINGSQGTEPALTMIADGIRLANFSILHGGYPGRRTAVSIHSNHSTIENCSVICDDIELKFEDSSNNTITDCRLLGIGDDAAGNPVYWGSNDNLFLRCEIAYNYGHGIPLHGERTIVRECTFHHNDETAIRMGGSGHIFADCTFYENGVGLELDESKDILIEDCVFYQNHDGIRLWQYEPVNITIQRCRIYQNRDFGLRIIQHTEKSTIRDCQIYDNGVGIALYDHSNNNTIQNCTISNNTNGFTISQYCHANKIQDCRITNNQDNGISLSDSWNNIFEGCTIAGNNNGTTIGGTIYGNYARNNLISHCTILNNHNYGLLIDSTSKSIDENEITYCDFTGNNRWNIKIQGYCFRNSIHHNILRNALRDAIDSCPDYWDDGQQGNYYDQYHGTDTNNDGIGDTPYHLGTYTIDRYPLMTPQDPQVTLLTPKQGYFYRNDIQKLHLKLVTLIIGPVTIKVDAQSPSGIQNVEFYIDNTLTATSTTPPYQWTWEAANGLRHTITIIAHSQTGNSSSTSLRVWKWK